MRNQGAASRPPTARGPAVIHPSLYQLDRYPAPNHCRCPLQAGERDVVSRIKNTVNLCPARFEQRCHARLGYFLFLHGLGELPRDDFLNRLCLRLFKDAFLLEEIVDARTHMFLAHGSISLRSEEHTSELQS